jgi:hypothetical protein
VTPLFYLLTLQSIPAAAESAAATLSAAATAAASSAAAISTATATTTGAMRTLRAGLGFIDGQGSAIILRAVQGRNGRLGLLIAAHFDETEAFAAAGIAVADDLGRLHGSVRAKQFFQLRRSDVVAQIPDV